MSNKKYRITHPQFSSGGLSTIFGLFFYNSNIKSFWLWTNSIRIFIWSSVSLSLNRLDEKLMRWRLIKVSISVFKMKAISISLPIVRDSWSSFSNCLYRCLEIPNLSATYSWEYPNRFLTNLILSPIGTVSFFTWYRY